VIAKPDSVVRNYRTSKALTEVAAHFTLLSFVGYRRQGLASREEVLRIFTTEFLTKGLSRTDSAAVVLPTSGSVGAIGPPLPVFGDLK
jgi:hypothetical protein